MGEEWFRLLGAAFSSLSSKMERGVHLDRNADWVPILRFPFEILLLFVVVMTFHHHLYHFWPIASLASIRDGVSTWLMVSKDF